MDSEEMDFRTPLQKEKAERNRKLYSEYLEIMKAPPEGTTRWGIFRGLGVKYNLSAQGVRGVVAKMKKNDSKNKI